MKLPIPLRDLQRDLKEFDIWITPSLGEITDTSKFKEELARITVIFEELGVATGNFQDEEQCRPEAIAETFANLANGKSEFERAELFKSLASTLYLVTGKTDNNSKCQFPLYLRDVARWDKIPSVKSRKGSKVIEQRDLPRTIESDVYMDLVAKIDNYADQKRLLEQFISFLLVQEDAIRQFWSLGYSYFTLKQFNREYERNLLSPIVIFKVRGSVTASGGHEPETILRDYLSSWGLRPDVDFNMTDVIVDKEGSGKEKTRAYDFVLPYKTPGWFLEWDNRLMIQSQFYAGDSGSVSHKNVDQTQTSRTRVLKKFKSSRFIEYVDGAGYFSSLNSDLRKLLAMTTTQSFIQIRSAFVRLRREFQSMGFLTPLEIEHAIVRSDGDVSTIGGLLANDGYTSEEIRRAIEQATVFGTINKSGNTLSIREERRDIIRRTLLLDVLAIHGREVQPRSSTTSGSILIPGYGPFYGLEMDELVNFAISHSGILREEIEHSKIFSADIKALSQSGVMMVR